MTSAASLVANGEAVGFQPPPHVHSKPGGAMGLSRLLLIKPDGTFDEILDDFLDHG